MKYAPTGYKYVYYIFSTIPFVTITSSVIDFKMKLHDEQ